MAYDSNKQTSDKHTSGSKGVTGRASGRAKSGTDIDGPSGQFSKFSDIGKLADGTGGKGRQTKYVGYHRAD